MKIGLFFDPAKALGRSLQLYEKGHRCAVLIHIGVEK